MFISLKNFFENGVFTKGWKRIAILVVVVLISFSFYGFTKLGKIGFEKERIRNTLSNPGASNPISLHQAWEIAIGQAKQYAPNARLVKLASAGHSGDTASSGLDGKRLSWLAIAVSSDDEWWLMITNGAITNVTQKSRTVNLLPLEKPVLDSPEALNLALKSKPEFKPETELGWGYHFALTYIRDEEGASPNPLVITAIGAEHRRTSIVSINALDGRLEQAKNQVFDGGGILFSKDAGKTWNLSNLADVFVTKIARDLWVDQKGYAAATRAGRIVVYATENGGESWQLWGALPAAAEDWPFCIEVVGSDPSSRQIWIGTRSGLWASSDGQAWFAVENVPEGPKQWMGQARSGNDFRLLVTITSGPQQGLYAGDGLSAWEKLSGRAYHLSESFDKKSVLATDENLQDENSVLRIDVTQIAPVRIPGQVMFAAGDFDAAFVAKDLVKGIGQIQGQNSAWDAALNPSSLDASPKFQADHTLVMAGFRSGVFRTTDGGKSWEKVIDNLNSLIPSKNEVFDVKFLSASCVVVVSGGEIRWEDF